MRVFTRRAELLGEQAVEDDSLSHLILEKVAKALKSSVEA